MIKKKRYPAASMKKLRLQPEKIKVKRLLKTKTTAKKIIRESDLTGLIQKKGVASRYLTCKSVGG